MNGMSSSNGIAQIGNLALCNVALESAISRPGHLPGIVCYHGPVGWGKSISSNHIANRRDAVYLQVGSEWKKKYLAQRICFALGIEFRDGDSTAKLVAMAGQELASSDRPLIIDEFDHVVKNRAVDIVRDLYEESRAAIMIVGEENLPTKLKEWKQFSSRTLWVPAEPANIDDARKLQAIYCPDVQIQDDLLQRIVDGAKGSARNICQNIELVRQETLNSGEDEVSLKSWGSRKLIPNAAPKWEGVARRAA